MPMRSFRTAIVGTGAVANAHAWAFRQAPEQARLVAVTDVDADRAKGFAEQWDIPAVYEDLATLLAEQAVDVVHVCTPPKHHVPVALACLEAGVTVLMEKPPALSLSEMDVLVEAERRSTATVGTVFQHRFGAAAIRLRQLAATGELGRPLLAASSTLWYRDEAYFEVPWRGTWEDEGGGPTMGHGIHQFDLLLSVLGSWQEVRALAVRQARRVQTEDVAMALVTFASGAVATVVNSVLSPRQTSALRFDFERATVELEHLYGYTEADWTLTPAPGHDDLKSRWTSAGPDVTSSHLSQFTAVYAALERGEPVPVGLAEARDTLEFAAAVYASAFTGRGVARGEIGPGNAFYERMDGTGAPWGGAA
jgi:predicted dehydrogenase